MFGMFIPFPLCYLDLYFPTEPSSQIRNKLRDWAVGKARAGCDSQAGRHCRCHLGPTPHHVPPLNVDIIYGWPPTGVESPNAVKPMCPEFCAETAPSPLLKNSLNLFSNYFANR